MEADWKNILLQGKRIDAEKALREAPAVHEVPSLVPADWQLVRRSPNGAEQVLATRVASYDIGADGAVVYHPWARCVCDRAGWGDEVGRLTAGVVK